MAKIFLNHTNHPSTNWSSKQVSAAKFFGEIKDFPFPNIPPNFNSDEVKKVVMENLQEILKISPAVVLCQGEFNYTFEIVPFSKKRTEKSKQKTRLK